MLKRKHEKEIKKIDLLVQCHFQNLIFYVFNMFDLYQSEIESYKYLQQIKYHIYLTNTWFFSKHLANAQIQRE